METIEKRWNSSPIDWGVWLDMYTLTPYTHRFVLRKGKGKAEETKTINVDQKRANDIYTDVFYNLRDQLVFRGKTDMNLEKAFNRLGL